MPRPTARFIMLACLLSFFSITVLTACTAEIDESETVTLGDRLYRRGSDEPFTGIVRGEGREGYRRQTCTFEKHYEDGILEGRSQYWYENGKLESIVPYQNGKIHGVVTRYHENGHIKARIHFVEGLRGGSKGEAFWDEDGKRVRG